MSIIVRALHLDASSSLPVFYSSLVRIIRSANYIRTYIKWLEHIASVLQFCKLLSARCHRTSYYRVQWESNSCKTAESFLTLLPSLGLYHAEHSVQTSHWALLCRMTASNPNIPFVNILSPLLIAAYLQQHGEISRDRQEASNDHSRREMAVDRLEDHVRRAQNTRPICSNCFLYAQPSWP